MPKRVETVMGDGSSAVDNEIFRDNNGLVLYYNGSEYEYNGNIPLMRYVHSKGEMGLNNTNADQHYTESVNNMTEESNNGGVIL